MSDRLSSIKLLQASFISYGFYDRVVCISYMSLVFYTFNRYINVVGTIFNELVIYGVFDIDETFITGLNCSMR